MTEAVNPSGQDSVLSPSSVALHNRIVSPTDNLTTSLPEEAAIYIQVAKTDPSVVPPYFFTKRSNKG